MGEAKRRRSAGVTVITEGRKVRLSDLASAEVRAALEAQREEFVRKLGREPGPNDPVFFDPTVASPQPHSPVQSEEMWRDIL